MPHNIQRVSNHMVGMVVTVEMAVWAV